MVTLLSHVFAQGAALFMGPNGLSSASMSTQVPWKQKQPKLDGVPAEAIQLVGGRVEKSIQPSTSLLMGLGQTPLDEAPALLHQSC